MGVGNDFRWEGQVLTEVLDSLVGEVAVVPLPVEGDSNVTTAFERLHKHQNFKVGWSLDVRVSFTAVVFLDNANSFLEKVAESSNAMFLGDPHGSFLFSACRIL